MYGGVGGLQKVWLNGVCLWLLVTVCVSDRIQSCISVGPGGWRLDHMGRGDRGRKYCVICVIMCLLS